MDTTKIKRMLNAHPKASYYMLLLAAVTALFFLAQAYIMATGYDLIWSPDPKPQYINFLFWGMNALGETFNTLINDGILVMPMYTYSLGYGADAIVSMGSYLQDPLNIIVFLFPKEMVAYSYPLMAFVRVYLAAVAFSIYCFGRGHGRKATGIASIIYVTCGFILFLGLIRHAKFIDWAILLPLALRAIDLIYQGKGKAMFVVVMFFQFMTSIYFTYMTCFVLLVYCLIKYFLVPRERSVQDFVKLVLLVLGLWLLAFLLSGPFTIPQILGLLSQSRVTGGRAEVALLFPLTYYLRIPVHLIGADPNTEGMFMCCVATLTVLIFLFGRKHFDRIEWRVWTIAIVICVIGLLEPYFGSILNAMSYSTDRWMLIMGFVFAYVACLVVPKLGEIEKREWFKVGIAVAFIIVVNILYAIAMYIRDGNTELVIWPAIACVVFMATTAIIIKTADSAAYARSAIAVGVCTIFCAALSVNIYCTDIGIHWIGEYSKNSSIYRNLMLNSPAVAIEEIGDDGLYRYSEARVQKTKNSALAHEPVMGVDFYTSYYNQFVDSFRQELGISDHHMNFSYCGHDSRLAIENFTGVKYYVATDKDAWRVPYGYVDSGNDFKDFKVYQNQNPVPLAFLADGIIDYETYQGLSMEQRQEALYQGAVVDSDEVSPELQTVTPEFNSESVPYQITDYENLTYEDGVFHVLKPDASVTIAFTGIGNCETYLSLEGLDYEGYKPSKRAVLLGGEVGKRQIFGDMFWSERTSYPMEVTSGKRSKSFEPVTPRHRRYGGKVNWILNLGYDEKPVTEMTLHFSYAGDYKYSDMSVVCQHVEPIIEKSNHLASQALDGLELHRNGMSATAELDDNDPRIAVFTIAYGTGWSVTVDGEPAKALKTDTGFLGVEVQGAGSHDIEWKYETPGLRIGFYMMVAGIVVSALLIGIYFLQRRRNNL